MEAEAASPGGPTSSSTHARSWPRALGLAAAFMYVPQLLPVFTTDLMGHAHCIGVYARFFPILVGLPFGINARILSGVGEPLEEYVLLVVAVLVTLTLLGGSTYALRRWRRAGLAVAGLVALVTAGFAMAAVAIIRE